VIRSKKLVGYGAMKTLSLVVLALAFCVTAVAAETYDVTGDWVFQVTTDQGSGSPSFTFKQEGEKLTGNYKGLLGEAPLTGTVSGKVVKFTFTGRLEGNEITVTYDGEIVSADALKGTIDFGGMAKGTFTGARKK
jgi:hypothetical protein